MGQFKFSIFYLKLKTVVVFEEYLWYSVVVSEREAEVAWVRKNLKVHLLI